MQVKDISDLEILEAVANKMLDTLCEKYPWKIVLRKLEQVDRKGYINYGTGIWWSWLEPEGELLLATLKMGGKHNP